jgi:peptide/nickel transport system permease protein
VNGSLPGYLGRRLLLLLLTMVLVPSLSFVLFTLIQGDHTAPLDVLRQLATYLSATFLQADFGSASFQSDTFIRTRSAFDVIADGFLVDVYLLSGAILVAVVLGVLAGAVQATRPRSFVARVISLLVALVLSSPVYWVGLMVLLLFAPGVGSVVQIPFLSTVGAYRDPIDDPLRFVQSLWFPCLIIGAPLLAGCARMTHGQLASVLGEDFVRTARAKGLSGGAVLFRHALPAAAVPVVALIGVNMNLILTNMALIEVVFNIPGGYRYIERALINRDVDLVQALVLESTFFIVMANFLADAATGSLDPRVRTGEPI